MSELAKNFKGDIDLNFDKTIIIKGRNSRTTDRKFREVKLRIEALTKRQIEILATGDTLSKKHIAFLAICKVYPFIREFVVELVREKALVFDYQITDGEYTTFLRRKTNQHPELDELAESTMKKVREVTFKILEQAGLIDNVKTKRINPQLVEEKVIKAVAEDDPEWLKIFLLPDMEIASRTR